MKMIFPEFHLLFLSKLTAVQPDGAVSQSQLSVGESKCQPIARFSPLSIICIWKYYQSINNQ